jgi:hypothetical protein
VIFNYYDIQAIILYSRKGLEVLIGIRHVLAIKEQRFDEQKPVYDLSYWSE